MRGNYQTALIERESASPRKLKQINPYQELASLSYDPNHIRNILFEKGVDSYHLIRSHSAPILKEKYLKDNLTYTCPSTGFEVKVPNEVGMFQKEENPKFIADFLTVLCDIYDQGEKIGDAGFSFAPDANGDIEMRIGTLNIRNHRDNARTKNTMKNMGEGFGKGFISHLEQVAKRGGAKRIALHAVGAGGYVWNRLGYNLDPRIKDNNLLNFKNYAIEKAKRIDCNPTLIKEIEKAKTWQDLGQVGKEEKVYSPLRGGDVHLGAYLLSETHWDGVKIL